MLIIAATVIAGPPNGITAQAPSQPKESQASPKVSDPNQPPGSPQDPSETGRLEEVELLEQLDLLQALEILKDLELYKDLDALMEASEPEDQRRGE